MKLGLVDGATRLETVERMLHRFRCNNVSITDATLRPIGAGCYPLGAMVNHSCSPNCVVTFEPETSEMQFRALRPVEPDEELTHAYVDMALPRDTRQRRLSAQYRFDCRCPRCGPRHEDKQEDDRFLDADADGVAESEWSAERRSSVDRLLQLLETSTDTATVAHVLEAMRHELHPHNIHILEALSLLFNNQMQGSAAERAAALATGEQIREVKKLIIEKMEAPLNMENHNEE
ncbi:hypothetical protein ATCC90586_004266 [Pythium insidiosum]|nr:hypothetical protein ATCC90586_004266 [Pythium insidiosum]